MSLVDKRYDSDATDTDDDIRNNDSNVNINKCNWCDFKYLENKEYIKHLQQIHRDDERSMCLICNEKYYIYYLNDHMLIHSNIEPYECEKCKKKFKTKLFYNAHLKSSSCFNEIKCSICGKEYKILRSLKNHLKKHTPQYNLKCQYCELKFKTYMNRYYHYMIVHKSQHIYKHRSLIRTKRTNLNKV